MYSRIYFFVYFPYLSSSLPFVRQVRGHIAGTPSPSPLRTVVHANGATISSSLYIRLVSCPFSLYYQQFYSRTHHVLDMMCSFTFYDTKKQTTGVPLCAATVAVTEIGWLSQCSRFDDDNERCIMHAVKLTVGQTLKRGTVRLAQPNAPGDLYMEGNKGVSF